MKDLRAIVDAAEATGGYDGSLHRAMEQAPALIVEHGLGHPFGVESLQADAMMATVMGPERQAREVEERDALEALVQRAAPGDDLDSIAWGLVNGRQDASYTLGLAVGLTFATFLRGQS